MHITVNKYINVSPNMLEMVLSAFLLDIIRGTLAFDPLQTPSSPDQLKSLRRHDVMAFSFSLKMSELYRDKSLQV